MMLASQDLMTLLRHSAERARLEAEDECRTREFYDREMSVADMVGGGGVCLLVLAAFFLLLEVASWG